MTLRSQVRTNQISGFWNANSKCKKVIRTLKATSSPIYELNRNLTDIESYAYDTTLIEVISNSLEKNNDVKWLIVLTVVSKGIWKGILGNAFLETMIFFLEKNPKSRP